MIKIIRKHFSGVFGSRYIRQKASCQSGPATQSRYQNRQNDIGSEQRIIKNIISKKTDIIIIKMNFIDKRVSTKQAIEILTQNGIHVDEDEAAVILDFLYLMSKNHKERKKAETSEP